LRDNAMSIKFSDLEDAFKEWCEENKIELDE